MAKVIRSKDVLVDKEFDVPLTIKWGIHLDTVKSPKPKMVMGHAVVPSGGRNRRHYYVKAEMGMFIQKGRLRFVYGPDYDQKEAIAEQGDFIHISRGEIHGLTNLSDNEPVEFYFCLGERVASGEEASVFFIDPPQK